MPKYGEPTHRVADPSPGVFQSLGAMSFRDYFNVAAMAGAGVPFGMIAGEDIYILVSKI